MIMRVTGVFSTLVSAVAIGTRPAALLLALAAFIFLLLLALEPLLALTALLLLTLGALLAALLLLLLLLPVLAALILLLVAILVVAFLHGESPLGGCRIWHGL